MGLTPDGGPDRRKRSGKTKAEVAHKVKELEAQRDAGLVTSPGRHRRSPSGSHWLDNIVALRVSPATLAGYESDIRLYAIPGIGRHRSDKVTRTHRSAIRVAIPSGQVPRCHPASATDDPRGVQRRGQPRPHDSQPRPSCFCAEGAGNRDRTIDGRGRPEDPRGRER